jgi:mono/diheme cytochrome c family protein
LWSDDAKKLRHVHVPTKGDKTGSKPQGIRFDAKAKRFEIPDNTRFYKTFLKEVRTATGSLAYRKIETRIIVVRTPWEKSLFGSYRWNDSETEATLVTQPYRNGQPFKDTIFPIEVDETTHAMKSYAIPAKHRCVECHQGAEGRNFVLGFTPLQVRRRDAGTGGTDGTHGPLGPDERNQVRRFLDYGVLEGIRSEDDLPALEDALDRPSDGVQGNAGVATETAPRRPTPWALDAQAYLLGNCAHCHNPEGFATRQDNRLASFDLRAGKLFEFPVATRGVSSGNLLVSAGNPAGSELYQRVANPTQLQGIVALQHMPLHTPSIDCQAVDRIGRWIASIPMDPGSKAPPEEREKARVDAEQRAKAFDAQCKPGQSLPWVDEDFTELSPYHPRRGDWQDPTTGIPPALRALDLSKEVEELARTPIATGYWNKNDACAFPSVDKPEGGVRPWMVDRQGKPKRPYGEVYFQTAGSHFFSSVCQKCHGPKANGDSGIAKLLSAQTGGTVRVANLMDGLFGDKGSNLSLFSVREGGQSRNLAGNYFIWMASGGTKVPFPPGFSELVGSYGGNMLSRIRDQFARLLPGHRNPMAEYYQTYDVYARVATLGNPMPSDAGYATNGTPLNEPIQRAWLDRAQGNAGWVLFQFFRNEAASGQFPLSPNDCQKAFAKTP